MTETPLFVQEKRLGVQDWSPPGVSLTTQTQLAILPGSVMEWQDFGRRGVLMGGRWGE